MIGRAFRWQLVAVVVCQLLLSALTLFVARATDPHAFAVWGLATVLLNAKSAVNLGFGQSLIYRRRASRAEADAALTLTLAGAAVVTALVVALAPVLVRASLHDTSGGAVSALRVVALALFFLTLEDVPLGLIERTLDFRRRAIPEMMCTLVYAIAATALLAAGAGIWALVVGRALLAAARFAAFWSVSSRPRVRFRMARATVAPLVRYGVFVNVAAVLSFLVRNADTVAAGRTGGRAALGVYALAFTVANLVPNFLGDALARVAFPVFAASRDSAARLAEGVRTALHIAAVAILPTAALLALVGPPLLVSVFGSRWTATGTALRWLSLYIVGRVALHVSHAFLMAVGRQVRAASLHALALVLSLGLLPLTGGGAAGVAATFAVGQVVAGGLALALVLKRVGPSALRVAVPAAAGTVAAGAAALAARGEIPAVAAALLFGLVYATVLAALDREVRALVPAPGLS